MQALSTSTKHIYEYILPLASYSRLGAVYNPEWTLEPFSAVWEYGQDSNATALLGSTELALRLFSNQLRSLETGSSIQLLPTKKNLSSQIIRRSQTSKTSFQIGDFRVKIAFD